MAPARTGPIRVVLADDTPDIIELLRFILKVDGRFEIAAEASDGLRAVEAAGRTQPDVVVLDLAMPVMDGLQAITQIRRVAPATRIVVLSGFTAERMAEQARVLGADAYLEKGGAFADLVPLLFEVCAVTSETRRAVGVVGLQQDRRQGALPGEEAAELLSFVSHELSTPVTVIQGFALTLANCLDRMDHETIAQAADAIRRQSQHLAEMIQAFARARVVEVDALTLDREPRDVGAFVEQTVTDLGSVIDPHPIVLSTAPVIASIDPMRVREVLTNLIGNAGKFSEPGEPIEVGVRATDSEVEVAVLDRCQGIPVDRESELFRKFSRLGTSHVTGTGLGLYISRGIARAHGGDLLFSRTDDGRCCFTLRLPLGA